jgi:hypothetical protein
MASAQNWAKDVVQAHTPALIWPALVLGLIVIIFLTLSAQQRRAIWDHLRPADASFRNLEAPRSPLLDRKALLPIRGEYAALLPPSQRHLLDKLRSSPEGQATSPQEASVGEDDFRQNLVGFEENYRECDPNKFLPSGLRVREIDEIGDFPDFELLTGVPHPRPCHDFDIDKALPRPYRPFRWPYYQTMSLSKLEPDWWLELEGSYRERIAQRKALFQKDGEAILAYLPGSELACKELMEMVLQYVVHRYPHYFSLSHNIPSSNGDSETTTVFHNKILNNSTDVYSIHPLHVLLEHIPEDFVLMLRDPNTGQYIFRAGIICSSLGWNLGSKFGSHLAQIHHPVPHYESKMKFSMDRFFAKLSCNRPIQRGSWGFEVDQPLYMAPGDPAEELYKKQQYPGLSPERIHVRVDWQTLRRLPLSAGIVFNFKALFTPLAELRNEPYVPSLCLKVLREGNEGILKYKNTWHTEHVVMPVLEAYEAEQIRKGMMEEGWDAQTLDESPFFPGWEAKWRAKQGF